MMIKIYKHLDQYMSFTPGPPMMSIFLALLTLTLGVCQGQNEVYVDVEQGRVQGRSFELHTGNTVNRFWGIPFAKPPVGELRFQNPQDPEPFVDGMFEANTLPAACPQGGGLFIWTHPFWDKFSEDCLTLNIFAPNDTSGGPYSVMFWIHGGGYTGSSNVQYPGYFLADRGVVFVAINYRLGNLGFMMSGDAVAPGNYGILDQIQALKWVQRNIAAFGGNPNDVTIFGQSAGGSSTGILLVSPLARGLFHKAICESGTEMAVWAVYGPNHEPENYSKQIAAQLNCTTDDSAAMFDCLRTVDAMDLYKPGFTCKAGQLCLGLAPVLDGPDGLLPDMPVNLRLRGEYAHVPVINGNTKDDGSLYTISFIPESLNGGFSRAKFEEVLVTNLINIFAPAFPDRVEDVFQGMNFYYSPYPNEYDLDANREAFNVMITDFGFGMMGDQSMKFHSATDDTYYYVLGMRSTNASRIIPEWMGVPHNGELPYVLGMPMLQENLEVRLDCLILDIIDWNAEDQEYADFVMTLWTNFAKYGNPTPEPVPGPFGQPAVTWPMFSRGDQNYLVLDYEVELRKNYRQQNFAFFLQYGQYVTGLDFYPAWNDTVHIPGDSYVQPERPGTHRPVKEHPGPNAPGMSSKMVEENLQKFYDLIWENYQLSKK